MPRWTERYAMVKVRIDPSWESVGPWSQDGDGEKRTEDVRETINHALDHERRAEILGQHWRAEVVGFGRESSDVALSAAIDEAMERNGTVDPTALVMFTAADIERAFRAGQRQAGVQDGPAV